MAIWIRRRFVNRELRAVHPDISFSCEDPSEVVFSDAARESAFGDGQEDEDRQSPYVSSLTRWERRLAHATRLNLLLIATDVDPRELLEALRWDCPEPVMTWAPGEVLILPANAQTGTLLLEDVSALTLEDQRRLYGWLETSTGWMQVVSITSRSLLPSIQEGAFLEMLYYRLNIICGEVARVGDRPQVRL